MPDSRLERTRKLYTELNISLPDTSRPHWWVEEYEQKLFPTPFEAREALEAMGIVVKSDPNA